MPIFLSPASLGKVDIAELCPLELGRIFVVNPKLSSFHFIEHLLICRLPISRSAGSYNPCYRAPCAEGFAGRDQHGTDND